MELAFASLIAVSVVISLVFAIAVVSPEQGVLQVTQSTLVLTSATKPLLTIDMVAITTETASSNFILNQTSVIPVSSTMTVTSTFFQTEIVSTSSMANSSVSSTATTSSLPGTQSSFTSNSSTLQTVSVATSATSISTTTTIESTTQSTTQVTTTLGLSCSPSQVVVSGTAICVVTVNNIANFPNPTGTVSFSSNMPGTFSKSSCTLDSSGSCSVSYTPRKGSAGSATTITAAYSGDVYHTRGSGSTKVKVTAGD